MWVSIPNSVCSDTVVPEAGPKLIIIGETPTARCRIAEAGDYRYVEQNTAKKSPWTSLAKNGHEIWWEFNKRRERRYTGRLLVDGHLYTVNEAKKALGVK